MPVYRLLGAEKRPIFSYATGGYYQLGAPDKVYADELAGYVKAGFRGVKLKTGGGTVAEEARRVRAVREAIGKDVSLMLDMNAPYDIDDCIAFARAVEPLGIFWLRSRCTVTCSRGFRAPRRRDTDSACHGERELTRFTVRDSSRPAHPLRAFRFDVSPASPRRASRPARRAARRG